MGLEDSTNDKEQGAHANSRDEARQPMTKTVCHDDEKSIGNNQRNKEGGTSCILKAHLDGAIDSRCKQRVLGAGTSKWMRRAERCNN